MSLVHLMAVPAELLARVASGGAVVSGALVKDAATQQILAHLQPTGGLGQWLLQTALAGPSAPFESLGLLTQSVQSVQLMRLQQMLETVQLIGSVGAAASVLNLGVSVGGFVLVMQRLGALQERLEGLAQQVGQVQQLQQASVFGPLRRALQQLDDAFLLSTDEERLRYWREVEKTLGDGAAMLDQCLALRGVRPVDVLDASARRGVARLMLQADVQELLGWRLTLAQAHVEVLLCLQQPRLAHAVAARLGVWAAALPHRADELAKAVLDGRLVAPSRMQQVVAQARAASRWWRQGIDSARDRGLVVERLCRLGVDTQAHVRALRQATEPALKVLALTDDTDALRTIGLA
jgi:hypothetical protein